MREIRHANLFLGKQRDGEESSEDEEMGFDEGIWMGMEQHDMPDVLSAEVSEFYQVFNHLKKRVREAAQAKKDVEKSQVGQEENPPTWGVGAYGGNRPIWR